VLRGTFIDISITTNNRGVSEERERILGGEEDQNMKTA
jgi:hypothetical protein